jgi:hypothetical protein
MSNYTKATNFATKDVLLTGNPLKTLSGTELDDEFNSIATAVSTKLNVNNAALTGLPTAPTAALGTTDSQLATTAFVTSAVSSGLYINEVAYPVGSVYTSVVATDPSVLLGVGTWVAFGAGRVLVGIDVADLDFDTVEEEGGAKTTSHALTTAELPAHAHDIAYGVDGTGASPSLRHAVTDISLTTTTATTGSGDAHTHDTVQPYITVYFWKRTV